MTNYVVESRYDSVQHNCVLSKTELLSELDRKGIRNAQIADALGLPTSRISEIFRAIRSGGGKPRELTYDEGVRLIRAFGLEEAPRAQALPASILRLAVLHVMTKLRTQATEVQIEELAEDLRAFSEYVTDPKRRRSVDAAEGFFQALQIRHPENDKEAPQGSDPETETSDQ